MNNSVNSLNSREKLSKKRISPPRKIYKGLKASKGQIVIKEFRKILMNVLKH